MQRLKDLLLRLREGNVDFVLVGGFGAVSLGVSMVTRDVDIACRMDPDNLIRVFAAFEELHPVHRMTPRKLPFTLDQAEVGTLKNLYLSTDWGQLNCLGEIKGIGGYAECLAESDPLDFDGGTVHVLSLDAMIRAKRAMGRPRDLHTALELEAIREKSRGAH